MAVNRRSQGTLSGAISRGINLDEKYTFTSTEKDDLVADFESTVDLRLRNRLSHINSASELSMVSRGLKFILDEKLSSHQMQRRSLWTTRTNYRDTTETSCAISDSGTTELFMFKIVGGVKITEKYRLFMRFVKYEADLHWKVMSLVSSEDDGRQQLRRMFNQANTSEGGSSRIDNAMVHLSNPPRQAIAYERPHQQPQCYAEPTQTNFQRNAPLGSASKSFNRRQEPQFRHQSTQTSYQLQGHATRHSTNKGIRKDGRRQESAPRYDKGPSNIEHSQTSNLSHYTASSRQLSYLNHLIGEGWRSFSISDAAAIALIDYGIDDPSFVFELYSSLP